MIRRGFLSEEDTAEVMGIAVTTLQGWRRAGRSPDFLKIGRKVWYRESAIEDWIEKNIIHAAPQTKQPMALQIPNRQPKVHGEHRFGGYAKKRREGQGDGVSSTKGGSRRNLVDTEDRS